MLVLRFSLIFTSILQEISVLCPQLGGLALLLCVGEKILVHMHDNSSGGMSFRYGWIFVLHDGSQILIFPFPGL